MADSSVDLLVEKLVVRRAVQSVGSSDVDSVVQMAPLSAVPKAMIPAGDLAWMTAGSWAVMSVQTRVVRMADLSAGLQAVYLVVPMVDMRAASMDVKRAAKSAWRTVGRSVVKSVQTRAVLMAAQSANPQADDLVGQMVDEKAATTGGKTAADLAVTTGDSSALL
jgi:hypothetical protein